LQTATSNVLKRLRRERFWISVYLGWNVFFVVLDLIVFYITRNGWSVFWGIVQAICLALSLYWLRENGRTIRKMKSLEAILR
jgi:hypothetical protein